MNKRVLSVFLLTMFIIGCTTFPRDDIEVAVDADPKANFSGYKTYAWLGSVGIVNDPQGKWEPPQFDADAEIVFQIDQALRKQGATEVDSNPDLLVAYALGLDMAALQVKQNPQTELKSLENVPQTGLVVLLIDPDTGFVIWAGVATAEFKNLAPEVAKQRVQYAVQEMFKHYPE